LDLFVRGQLHIGGGKLFQYIAKCDKKFLNVHWDTHGSGNSNPEDFLSSQAGRWSKFWSPKKPENLNTHIADEFVEFWKSARLQTNKQQFGTPQLDESLRYYKKDTLGSDLWSSTELKGLPHECKAAISETVHVSLQEVTICHQWLISLNALLGKPSKECRTVTKTPMLYRMALRADDKVQCWEHDNKQGYDTAKAGSSALLAALARNLTAELAHWLGLQFASIYNDYHKFFDTLDLLTVMLQAIRTGFPLDRLAFALQQHIAPRVLQANGYSSIPMQVWKSILAGCRYSVAMTRMYLQEDMVSLVHEHPQAKTELFVDDTSMHSDGPDNQSVIDILVPAMLSFKDKVVKLKLTLSPKAVIVTSNVQLTSTINKLLSQHGLVFVKATHTRDLGITSTAGKSRPKQLLLSRISKSKLRIKKISRLAVVSRKSRKLFNGSAFAMATWGHQGAGMSDNQILALERDALSCTGIKPAGRCRTLALLVAFGLLGTPRARIVRESVRAWFDIIRESGVDRINDIRVAWSKAKACLQDSNHNINKVHGLMSNIIYILYKAHWIPRTFNCWEDPEGSTWVIANFKVAPDIVAAAITSSYLELSLTLAAQHHNGQGIQNGVDVENTLRTIRAVKDKSIAACKFKATLETVMSAGSWSASRINKIDSSFSPVCPRCDHPVEDDLHTFWLCPCNANIDEISVKCTQKLVSKASADAAELPCLWLRGILPSALTQLPPEAVPKSQVNVIYVNPDSVDWTSRSYYGDASGGKYTSHRRLRRCGCGVVAVDSQGSLEFGMKCNLPGAVQTVGRGELFAFVLLVRHLPFSVDAEYITDNEPLYKTYNAGPRAGANSANCDLFEEVFSLICTKALRISMRWMPSHLKDGDELPEGVSALDVVSNDHADRLAKEAADAEEISSAIATPYLYNVTLTTRIQRRLATIMLYLPHREKKQRQPVVRIPRPKLDNLISESSHEIVVTGNRYACGKCHNSFRIADPSLKIWLQSVCIPVLLSSTSRPTPLAREDTLHIGNNTTHASHKLCSYRGLFYCNQCGARSGVNQIRKLSKPCVPAGPHSAGQVTLDRINAGRKPIGLASWADES
jgi:hypothetical protein